MKSLLVGIFIFIAYVPLTAQVFSGLAEIDKAKKEGFYTYLNTEEKNVTNAWKEYLNKTGTVDAGRAGSIHVDQARISSISDNPINLLSIITEEKNKIKLFVSMRVGPDNYIQTGHEKFKEASQWLEDFAQIINLQESLRKEESKLAELKSAQLKNQRYAERLVRELDSNKRQTELLTKKLEETRIEKEKILANQEQNKLDQKANELALEQQIQQVQSAKSKVK
jgi:hypothetical protein